MNKRDFLWLAVVGLLFQGLWLLLLPYPAYMDAYYYTSNGQRLAEGEGWTEMVVWQYLDDPAGVPIPSHTYWMPLPSLLAAAGYTLLPTFRGAQLPFWLMTGLLPLLSYALSSQMGGKRWQNIAAALLTMTGGFYLANWNQPETFAPFAWAGGGLSIFAGLGRKRSQSAGQLVSYSALSPQHSALSPHLCSCWYSRRPGSPHPRRWAIIANRCPDRGCNSGEKGGRDNREIRF